MLATDVLTGTAISYEQDAGKSVANTWPVDNLQDEVSQTNLSSVPAAASEAFHAPARVDDQLRHCQQYEWTLKPRNFVQSTMSACPVKKYRGLQ